MKIHKHHPITAISGYRFLSQNDLSFNRAASNDHYFDANVATHNRSEVRLAQLKARLRALYRQAYQIPTNVY